MGTIESGSARNPVADEALLEGEVRSHVAERVASAIHAIRDVFQSTALEANSHAETEADVQWLYTGYDLTDSDAMVALASRAFGSVDGARTSSSVSAGLVLRQTLPVRSTSF